MAQRRDLPYTTIGAAIPCVAGWVVLPGRMLGATILAEEPFTEKAFVDVLDHKPDFSSLVVGCPLAFPDRSVAGRRAAERAAAESLGWPRRLSVEPVPSRAAVLAPSFEAAQAIEPWLTRLAYRRFRYYREVEQEIQLFHQRKVFAASPELTFQMLNGDQPLTSSRHTIEGQRDRLRLVEDRMPGITLTVNEARPKGVGFRNLVDAAGLLWTARRIGGRVLSRVPSDPEWNDFGLRMEYLR